MSCPTSGRNIKRRSALECKARSIVGGVRYQSKGGAVCSLLLIAGKPALSHNTALNQVLKIPRWHHPLYERLFMLTHMKDTSYNLLSTASFILWDQKLSQTQREGFCQEVRTSKKEGMHKLAQKPGAKCGKLGSVSKEGWRGEVVGTWNTKLEKLPVFIWSLYVSSSRLNAFDEKDLKEKEA